MTPEDLTRITGRLRRLADLLDDRGTRALDLTRTWRDNLRASSLEPATHGGVATDPTGNGASQRTPVDQLMHIRLRSAIELAAHTAGVATDLIVQAVPDAPKHTTKETGPGPGWCTSCWRDNRYLEPEDTHRDGRVKHAGLCAWCHSFTEEHGQRPPLALLSKRHAGRRISTRDVAQALGRKTA